MVTGNYTRDSSGSGAFIKFASDDYNVFSNNSLPGWTIAFPPTKQGTAGGYVGIYSPNTVGPIGPT